MKKSTKLIIVGLTVSAVTVGFFAARHFINVNKENHSVQVIGGADGPITIFFASKIPDNEKPAEYTSISMEEAKEVFAKPGNYTILDVRRADEYAEGHIPGAINVANEDIGAEQPLELPDLNRIIFVYCRSGRRSKEASAKLAALGYTNIYEFGGILDWDGEIEK